MNQVILGLILLNANNVLNYVKNVLIKKLIVPNVMKDIFFMKIGRFVKTVNNYIYNL